VDYGLDLASVFQPDLLKDEKIVWSGQPAPGLRLSSGDLFLIPFSLLWGGFALFWEAGVLGIFDGHFDFGPAALFGIPFVVVGQYIIWGRFLYKSYRNRHTFYGVTNRRVLILVTTRTRRLQSLFLNQLPTINKTVRADGSGSLTFGVAPTYAAAYANTGMDFFGGSAGVVGVPAFYDIPQVDSVYQLIMRQKTDLDQTA
jgi:hypothetical protein